jgi:hypothetical protein
MNATQREYNNQLLGCRAFACIRVHSRLHFGRSAAHPPPGIIIALSGLDSAQRPFGVAVCDLRGRSGSP